MSALSIDICLATPRSKNLRFRRYVSCSPAHTFPSDVCKSPLCPRCARDRTSSSALCAGVDGRVGGWHDGMLGGRLFPKEQQSLRVLCDSRSLRVGRDRGYVEPTASSSPSLAIVPPLNSVQYPVLLLRWRSQFTVHRIRVINEINISFGPTVSGA